MESQEDDDSQETHTLVEKYLLVLNCLKADDSK